MAITTVCDSILNRISQSYLGHLEIQFYHWLFSLGFVTRCNEIVIKFKMASCSEKNISNLFDFATHNICLFGAILKHFFVVEFYISKTTKLRN